MYISWGEAPEAQQCGDVVVFYNQAELCFMYSFGVQGGGVVDGCRECGV